MKRILLLLLLFFSAFSYAQDEINIHDSYLSELLVSSDINSISTYSIDDIESRKKVIDKITSFSYIDPSFLKTTMLLNMLKYKLGDDVYNAAYNEYLIKVNHDELDVTALDFIKSIENSSQVDLSDFYNDWFIGKGYPSYEISWFQNEDKRISINVKQTQSDASVDFFEMPLPIEVIGEGGESQIIRLEISENNQGFNGYIPFKIISVSIDPEHQLITKNNVVKSGVDQEILNANIALYPNPAKGFINIQNSSEAVVEKVSVFNMLGKLVLVADNPTRPIDLKPLNFGLHLVKIETSQGTLHKTILKEQ